MSGETESAPSGWTVDTLLAYMTERLVALDDRVKVEFDQRDKNIVSALTTAKEAVGKAETAAEKRFDCCSADTPVLCADLTWRPAGDLLPGDELIAFDEESPDRRGRRFRRSTVVANSLHRDVLLSVATSAGTVRCNGEHPWLVQRVRATGSRAAWGWVNARDLVADDTVLHSVDVWRLDRSWDSGWLAGMYDGEGCLCFDRNGSVQLSVTQRESETSDRMVQALKARTDAVRVYRVDKSPSRPAHHRPRIDCIVSARADVMKVLGSVRPPRLMVNVDQAWDGKPLGGKHRTAIVTSVEPAGTGMVAALGTSTRTYIAGGFAMHNSVNEFRGQLSDQARTFLPRVEGEQRMEQVSEKIDRVDAQLSKNLSDLAKAITRIEDRKVALAAGYGYLVGFIGMASALVAIVVALSR